MEIGRVVQNSFAKHHNNETNFSEGKNMTAKSFKQMIKDGEIKRADAMKVRLEDLHEEPGFNLRREGEDLDQSVTDLAAFIAQGGQLPPLEVRPRAEGGVWLVDGHRRVRAYRKLEADGVSVRDASGELWLSVVAFNGNDAERVARVITSQEGRKLTPLELADGYKRLAAFGWSAEQIASKVGKTRQHVEQMLTLGNANSDVQQLVASGAVAAATAVAVVREHGEDAGKVLGAELDKAKAAGKSKVTAGTMKPKALPRDVVDDLVGTVNQFRKTLTPEALMVVHDFERGNITEGTVTVDAEALMHLILCAAEVDQVKAEQERKAREKADKAKQMELQEGAE